MKRLAVLAYGSVAYMLFLGSFLYAVGFIGNFWTPTSLDEAPSVPFGQALLINTLLLGAFALQHSVMARQGFKRWWTRLVPEPAERSTYVLATVLALAAIFAWWQPMGGVLWDVQDPAGRAALYGLFACGWALVLASTFLINHFDLFGLRQVWLSFRGTEYTPIGFRTPGLYRCVRHPLYVGWLAVFWATPTMTAAHLVFALLTTSYILIAIQLEERDLVAAHGPAYDSYRKNVPMLIPFLGRNRPQRVPVRAPGRV
jgi:protein-S-isoprenylcysteine O-methyltransferase Ste14